MKNYFKAAGNHIFFNDAKIAETEEAFASALELVGDVTGVSLFSATPHAGPWDRAGIVGHRRRALILQDIVAEQDPIELDLRRAELERLDMAYRAVGRDKTPVELVAA